MEWKELCDEVEAEYQRKLKALELIRQVEPNPEGLCWKYPEKFMKFVGMVQPQEDGCWRWIGSINQDGYGLFYLHGENCRTAHRVSYLFFKGYTAGYTGMEMRHTCHNPPCVHPHHLIIGSHQQNMQDMMDAGRRYQGPGQAGESNGFAALDGEKVMRIRGIFLAEPWRPSKDIAQEFGVADATICFIKKGRTWTHITDHILPPSRPKLIRRI